MQVMIEDNKLVLTQPPKTDVPGAFLLMTNKEGDVMLDAKNGQTEYDLPKGVDKKDIELLYLRII